MQQHLIETEKPGTSQQVKVYRDYLSELGNQVAHPEAGFFGPGSMAWRINREGVLGLGALRALLMQIAHPAVARGVAEHSQFRRKPFQRVYNTLQSQQVIVFGSVSEASDALLRMYARHTVVRGAEADDKRPYSGNDPMLQMWVLGTLVDTIIRSHAQFLKPLAPDEAEAFYEESKWFATLMGIPQELLPATLAEFNAWMDTMLMGDELEVGEDGKAIAHSLLRLPLPVFWPGNYLLAVGMLPESLRAKFGFRWTPTMQMAFQAGVGAVRAVAARLPARLRTSPMYWRATQRVSEQA